MKPWLILLAVISGIFIFLTGMLLYSNSQEAAVIAPENDSIAVTSLKSTGAGIMVGSVIVLAVVILFILFWPKKSE